MTPFPTLPGRKLAFPRGGRLRNGLRNVGVARPSSSRRQHTCRFAPLLLRFSRNSSVLARPSLAEHSWSEPAPVAVKILISRKICQNVRHDLEAFRRFYASETPIFCGQKVANLRKKCIRYVCTGMYLYALGREHQ
jgi:hypothetical protein